MPVDTKITSHKMTRPDMAHVQVEWDSITIFRIIPVPIPQLENVPGYLEAVHFLCFRT